jgi:ketosteroid isomerase-like protein
VTADDELIDLLNAFCHAFAAQDAGTLKAFFVDDDVCFVTSGSQVVHDRRRVEEFLDAYAAAPTSVSFEWDSCQVATTEGRFGWIVGFGREVRHEADGIATSPYRLTLVCESGGDGWRIAHLHGSRPLTSSA